MIQHFITQFMQLYYLLNVAYGRLNQIKENFKLLAKVVAVTHKTWSLTRGSKCSDLTWKLLVF